LVHTLHLRTMAKETRKQLPFDRDAINENLAWRIPLVLRICVLHRCSLTIRATRNRIFAVSFLVSWKQLSIWLTTWNWQTQNTHAGSLYHWWIGYFILEWEKDDHHDWNLVAKCETLEARLLVMFPLSCLQTCSVLWPFWWQGHWQAQPYLVGFPLWVITFQVKRQCGIKYYNAFFAVIVNGIILAKCLVIILVFPRLLYTKLTTCSTIIGYLP
jgi:hypothetical protein